MATGHALTVGRALLDNVNSVIRGKADAARLAVVALLSGGHLLVEDVPGTGKTVLAKTLAFSIGGTFNRVQGTPDLLPADITGASVYRPGPGDWEFHPGPVFANVVLVDELNRATPRCQSAFLEPMEERHVTVDGVTHPLPDPWFCIATQNPADDHGTFHLPDSHRDRFALAIGLGLPARDAERAILMGDGGAAVLGDIDAVVDPPGLRRAIDEVAVLHCAPPVVEYILDLVAATRHESVGRRGASPRAALGLLQAARAHAVVEGRAFVTPGDVQAVAVAALAHRLRGLSGVDRGDEVQGLHRVLDEVPVPRL